MIFNCIRSSDSMLEMINSLQSERIDSQRAELRPVQKEPAPGTSLPGLRAQHTTRTKPEDDFLEMIARVQVFIHPAQLLNAGCIIYD